MIKKIIVVFFVYLMLATSVWFCYESYRLKKEADWFNELYTDWHLFEADYREDIKNIDQLRADAESAESERAGWEKIAFEFKDETYDWQTKYFQLRDNPEIPYWARE